MDGQAKDLEIRSCKSKKKYGLPLALKLAQERNLRVYACTYGEHFHLTKKPWYPGVAEGGPK